MSELQAGDDNAWIVPNGQKDTKRLETRLRHEVDPKQKSTRCSRWPKWGMSCEPFMEAQRYRANEFSGYNHLKRELRITSTEFDVVVQKYWSS